MPYTLGTYWPFAHQTDPVSMNECASHWTPMTTTETNANSMEMRMPKNCCRQKELKNRRTHTHSTQHTTTKQNKTQWINKERPSYTGFSSYNLHIIYSKRWMVGMQTGSQAGRAGIGGRTINYNTWHSASAYMTIKQQQQQEQQRRTLRVIRFWIVCRTVVLWWGGALQYQWPMLCVCVCVWFS